MCAICGIYNSAGDQVDPAEVHGMTEAMAHRGPDGQGHFIDREAALGHRRLSIIDLETGGQPLASEDGRIQVIFNGEIYNHPELRAELEKLGHVFHTKSDTEVIVHAYEQWGKECVHRFNGMFSFAVWDRNSRGMLIARDHLGIKPLYYTCAGSRLIFASEIKALLRCTGVSAEMDMDALEQLFTFRYVPSPLTLFKGIRKLPPGHLITAGSGGFRIERYWNSVPAVISGAREEECTEEYQRLLQDTVRLQVRSDVPVGLFLSSGMDSALLLALMSTARGGPVKTFTVGFEGGLRENEVTGAARLAAAFGASHEVRMISPGNYMEYFVRYMRDLEEPVGNETAAAFYFLADLASKQVKVALCGQGADEVWAGYYRHKGVKMSQSYSRLPRRLTRALETVVAKLPGRMERIKRGAGSLGERNVLTRFARIHSFFTDEMKQRLFTGPLKERFHQTRRAPGSAIGGLHRDVQHLDPLTQILYLDTRSGLPDDLLMVSDKTSMAASIECRVPFLDRRLVEFAESLPPRFRMNGLKGKYLHRKAALKWLPPKVVHQPKKGFANPVEDWMRGPMSGFVQETLSGRNATISQLSGPRMHPADDP